MILVFVFGSFPELKLITKIRRSKTEYIQNVEKLGKDIESELKSQLDNILNSKNGTLSKAVSRESDRLTNDVQELFNSDKKSSVPTKIEKIVNQSVSALTKDFY